MSSIRSKWIRPVAAMMALALSSTPLAAAPGDFDDTGFVDLVDFATMLDYLHGPGTPPPAGPDATDIDLDGDVDLVDFAMFQTLYGHLPVPLKDTLGNPLAVDSTTPYSGRQTCGTIGCHNVDDIANAYHFQEGRTNAAGNIHMQDDFFGAGRWWQRSPGRHGDSSPAGGMRIFAGKQNSSPSQFDMTTYRWVAECGNCHPGGGGGEFDRDGELLYN